MIIPLTQVELRTDQDIVLARQRARIVASRLGFEPMEQARIATAVSEVARDAVQDSGQGRVEFLLESEPSQVLAVRVVARDLPMTPFSVPKNNLGTTTSNSLQGLAGARRMMDGFDLKQELDGSTVIAMTKSLPRRMSPITLAAAVGIVEELSRLDPPSPIDELISQNQDLIKALDDLRGRELELAELNRELEDTNRGVLALYLELDQKAESLKLASEMKTRFLSNVSHELRTPLTSILSLSRLLLDRTDGELTVEQERQTGFILHAAQDLTVMVNTLLDLARIEAGRDVIHVEEVGLIPLFGSLRGLLRPLLKADSAVELIFDDPSRMPTIYTDEGKLAQILRNLLSNALKFTEHGEIRVKVAIGPAETVVFTVVDTGIGIAPANFGRIFEEFGQVDSPLQRQLKGTGLGLPLARRLAETLGGTLEVASELGVGSRFTLNLPVRFPVAEVEDAVNDGRPDGLTVEIREKSHDA